MSEPLNDFEKDLLAKIVLQHSSTLALSECQISSLRVSNREPTGVGCYVNFAKKGSALFENHNSTELGFDGEIHVPKVPSGLGALLAINAGELEYIEIFTYGGEYWDGDTSAATISTVPPSAGGAGSQIKN